MVLNQYVHSAPTRAFPMPERGPKKHPELDHINSEHDSTSNHHIQDPEIKLHHHELRNQERIDNRNLRAGIHTAQQLIDGSMENVEFRDQHSTSSLSLSNTRHRSSSQFRMSSSLNNDDINADETQVDAVNEDRGPSSSNKPNTFTCDITSITRTCPKMDFGNNTEAQSQFLKGHIDELVSNTIHNLRDHVKGLGKHYEDSEGFDHQTVDRNLSGTLGGNNPTERQYKFNEVDILQRANYDLVKTACYLNKARTDAEDFGDLKTAEHLKNILHHHRDNYSDFFCKLRMWMDAVNVTVTEIIEIKHSERFRENLPHHMRKSWDYAILSTLSEYLERLRSDMELIELFRSFNV